MHQPAKGRSASAIQSPTGTHYRGRRYWRLSQPRDQNRLGADLVERILTRPDGVGVEGLLDGALVGPAGWGWSLVAVASFRKDQYQCT